MPDSVEMTVILVCGEMTIEEVSIRETEFPMSIAFPNRVWERGGEFGNIGE